MLNVHYVGLYVGAHEENLLASISMTAFAVLDIVAVNVSPAVKMPPLEIVFPFESWKLT